LYEIAQKWWQNGQKRRLFLVNNWASSGIILASAPKTGAVRMAGLKKDPIEEQ